MLKRYPLLLLIVMVVGSCDKNKLDTRPSIEIKDINPTEVFPGEQVVIRLEFKDKEGDLGGGTITYVRNRLNAIPIPQPEINDKADTVVSLLPDFPKTTSGEIELKIDHQFMDEDPGTPAVPPDRPAVPVNDTMVFKLYVKDLAGNVSDTITTVTLVEKQN